jgi:hypothetical protein
MHYTISDSGGGALTRVNAGPRFKGFRSFRGRGEFGPVESIILTHARHRNRGGDAPG